MKKIFSLVLALLVLSMEMYSLAEGSDAIAHYHQIMNSESIPLADACEKLGAKESAIPEVQELQELLYALQSCEGRFLQLPDDGAHGKVYSADISFYLVKGIPYCNIQYTGYGGMIIDGKVERNDVYGEGYMFVSHPAGEFLTNSTEFTLKFAPDQLLVTWADGICQYLLVRGTEEQLASANKELPFVETDTYKTLLQTIDKAFNGMEYSCCYEDENKTFAVYVECGSGYKNTLINHAANVKDKWQSILDSLLSFSENIDSALTLATRKGLTDYTQAQFEVIFVEELKQNNIYSEADHLAVVTDGEVTYNIVEEILEGKSLDNGYVYSAPSTTGESNALRQAKMYLEIMPFSYQGLVEQLEYEGYSYSEAVYGASNCGANWYEQAARSAENYLNLMPFSRSGLIEQLEYEGYTYDQAVYGAERNGY